MLFFLSKLNWYLLSFLFLIALIGTAGSAVYLVLVMVAAIRHRGQRDVLSPSRVDEPVSVLKPLHGREPQLYENLSSHFTQNYFRYEVIFCARHFTDPAFEVVDRIVGEHPERTVKTIACGEPSWINPRTFSVDRMLDAAAYGSLVITDSDVRVTPECLSEVVAELNQPGVGLVTCLYRGVASGGPWSFLEAIGMSVEMSSGVLVANMLEGMKFALGPCMAIRKQCISEIGGLEEIAEYYADDFVLGNRVADAGYEVKLSKYVVDHVVTNTAFLPSLRHQLGWMRSTRFSRPKGHLGTAFTFAMPYALLGFAVEALRGHWIAASILLGIGVSNRMLQSIVVGWGIVRDPKALLWSWAYPVRDLMGFLFWVASYGSSDVRYRGEMYSLFEEGKIRLKQHTREMPSPVSQ